MPEYVSVYKSGNTESMYDTSSHHIESLAIFILPPPKRTLHCSQCGCHMMCFWFIRFKQNSWQ